MMGANVILIHLDLEKVFCLAITPQLDSHSTYQSISVAQQSYLYPV